MKTTHALGPLLGRRGDWQKAVTTSQTTIPVIASGSVREALLASGMIYVARRRGIFGHADGFHARIKCRTESWSLAQCTEDRGEALRAAKVALRRLRAGVSRVADIQ